MAEESNPKLKRFTAIPFEDNAGNEFAANMEEMLDGEWVRYVDMQAEIERLRAQLFEARNTIDKLHDVMRGEGLSSAPERRDG